VLFDQLYSSIPKDPEARVQVYTAEIVPKGWTNFHCHNGATFFLALQGILRPILRKGFSFERKPAMYIRSRSVKCTAGTIRTTRFLISASDFASQLQIGHM
jgi:hypothetical protein